MSIKKQLSAYYDKQGLTGKHHRKAMQYDMKAVRANVRRDVYGAYTKGLQSAFYFVKSPQGHAYWNARC